MLLHQPYRECFSHNRCCLYPMCQPTRQVISGTASLQKIDIYTRWPLQQEDCVLCRAYLGVQSVLAYSELPLIRPPLEPLKSVLIRGVASFQVFSFHAGLTVHSDLCTKDSQNAPTCPLCKLKLQKWGTTSQQTRSRRVLYTEVPLERLCTGAWQE